MSGTLYSLGLKVSDIDAARARVHIRDAKGNRDRFVPLPEATLTALRQFWQLHRHPELLVPNRQAGLKAAHRARTPLDRGGVQIRSYMSCNGECFLRPIS